MSGGGEAAGGAGQTPGEGAGSLTPPALRGLAAEEFSLSESVGGVRGLIESVAPGLLFVVVFVASRDLTAAIVSSLAVTVVAVIARLATRTPLAQALSGVVGVAIGALWAWRSGQAEDYFAWGLWVNAAFALGVLVSLIARYPVVGLVVSSLRMQGDLRRDPQARFDLSWRAHPVAMRRCMIASVLWLGAFLARLAIQVPLYLSSEVGWLGTARLVMGLPLWALVLWATWVLVRPLLAPVDRDRHPSAS